MASKLQAFSQAAWNIAADVIGRESITISGGAAISGVLNESSRRRESEEFGMEQSGALEFVIDQTAFSAAYAASLDFYRGKIASARGESWRILDVRAGNQSAGQFVTLVLATHNKSS